MIFKAAGDISVARRRAIEEKGCCIGIARAPGIKRPLDKVVEAVCHLVPPHLGKMGSGKVGKATRTQVPLIPQECSATDCTSPGEDQVQ